MPEDLVGRRLREFDENWEPPAPLVGVRVAVCCPLKTCNRREFGNELWRCPEHGGGVRQENVPYFGRSTR